MVPLRKGNGWRIPFREPEEQAWRGGPYRNGSKMRKTVPLWCVSEGTMLLTSYRALLGAVRRVYSFGRSGKMVWFRDSFGRSGEGTDVRTSYRALLWAVRRVYSFGRSGKMVWFRDSFGRSGEGTDVRTSYRALLWTVRRVYSFGRSGKMVWLEGERKMRESVSPSEGGKCPLGGGTRQYGALAAVVHLRTFGR